MTMKSQYCCIRKKWIADLGLLLVIPIYGTRQSFNKPCKMIINKAPRSWGRACPASAGGWGEVDEMDYSLRS
jgi:hypothetical protein